ncbi:hypothetical protein KCU62_g150, partial [Aureobasidium sp. EXF-3399]
MSYLPSVHAKRYQSTSIVFVIGYCVSPSLCLEFPLLAPKDLLPHVFVITDPLPKSCNKHNHTPNALFNSNNLSLDRRAPAERWSGHYQRLEEKRKKEKEEEKRE